MYNFHLFDSSLPYSGTLTSIWPDVKPHFAEALVCVKVDLELLLDQFGALKKKLPVHAKHLYQLQEWISLRITLEHLAFCLAQVMLPLATAVADEYSIRESDPATEDIDMTMAIGTVDIDGLTHHLNADVGTVRSAEDLERIIKEWWKEIQHLENCRGTLNCMLALFSCAKLCNHLQTAIISTLDWMLVCQGFGRA